MKSVTMQRPGNVKIYYEIVRPEPQVLGEEPPVLVYLTGFGLNNTAFKHQRNHFQKLGAASVAPDQRGDGRSTHLQKVEDYALDAFVSDLESIVRAEDIRNFTIVGHSSGGMVAQQYAATHQEEIDSLVLISTSYDFRETFARTPFRRLLLEASPILNLFEVLYTKAIRVFTKGDDDHYQDFSEEQFKGGSELRFVLNTIGRKGEDYVKAIHKAGKAITRWNTKVAAGMIKTPTLLIHGDSDFLVPPQTVYDLHKIIPGAESIPPVIIPNAMHGVHFQAPELVIVEMERFLVGKIYKGRLSPLLK